MSKAFIQKISSFAPTQISGCQLWLDAADSTTLTGTSPVTQWRDKSGNSRNTTSYAGTPALTTNAINGVQAINFNGSSSFTGSIPASGNAYTIFFVGNFNASTSQYGGLVCFGSPGNVDNESGLTNTKFNDSAMYSTVNNTNSAFTVNTLSTPFIYSLVIDGTYINNFVNGNQQTPTNISKSSTFNFTNYVVANRAGSTGSIFLNGFVGEIIVFINGLTISPRQQVEGYLAQKWGLTANLPAGHPGLTQTFYIKNPGIATTPSRAMTNLPYTNLFSPISSSIGACQLWLDGTDTAGTGTAPANGTTVSTWVDKSGNGRNAVAVVAGTYSSTQRSITFSGTNYYNSSYTAAPTSETLFIVFNMTTNNNPFLIASSTCGGRVADPTELLVFTGGAICYTNGAATTAVVTLGSNTLGIVVTDGTNNYVSLHGALMLSGPVSVSYTGGTTTEIGGAVGANYLTNGYINEVIAYNSVLGTTQRQLVEGYLAWKWGLTSSLPSTHPFKSVPPGRPSQVAGIPLQLKMSAIRVAQLLYSGTYTTAGNFFATFTGNGSVTVLSPVTVNYFAIGGGGGGGNGSGGGPGGGGGGGAGGLQMGSMSLSEGTYNIVIGSGGPIHTNGSNTTFGSTLVVALGGGFGGNAFTANPDGGNGGCGGGAGSYVGVPGIGSQGSNGGNCANGGGGGGGIGGVGQNFINPSTGGGGGSGILYNGSYYGGGGGGGTNHGAGGTGIAGAGGLGGGGTGGRHGNDPPALDATSGTPNTGGGGGGGRSAHAFSGPGAAGGSGVFIISY